MAFDEAIAGPGQEQRWQVRACTTHDADALSLIGAATFLETYAGWLPGEDIVFHCRKNHSPESYEMALSKPATRAWLAEVKGAPVGYLLMTAPEMPTELVQQADTELKRIYLLSRFHGSGMSGELLREAFTWAESTRAGRILVGMHPDNRRAAAFYRRNGFAVIGKRVFQVGENTYVDPVMAKVLH